MIVIVRSSFAHENAGFVSEQFILFITKTLAQVFAKNNIKPKVNRVYIATTTRMVLKERAFNFLQ